MSIGAKVYRNFRVKNDWQSFIYLLSLTENGNSVAIQMTQNRESQIEIV